MLGHRQGAEATDRALDALSDTCRRRLLFELYGEGDSGEHASVSYSEIAPFRAAKQHTQLDHVHLPKLEEHGYIRWNRAEETVRKGPRWEEIEPILDLVYTHLCELPTFLQGKPPDKNGTNP